MSPISDFPGGVDDFHIDQADPNDMGAAGHTTHLAWTQKASDAIEKIETDLVDGHGSYGTLNERLASLVGGAAGVFGTPDAEVAESISAGAQAIKLTRGSPSSLFNTTGLIALGIGTPSNFEARYAQGLTGNQFGLNTPLRFAHDPAEPVFWLQNGLHPFFYGVTGALAIYWSQLQRMLIDAHLSGIPAYGGCVFYTDRALGLPGQIYHEGIYVRTTTASAGTTVDDTGWHGFQQPDGGIILGAKLVEAFTSDASLNRIIVGSSVQPPSVGHRAIYNNPDHGNSPAAEAAALPGGISSGKTYWIRTVTSLGGGQYAVTLSPTADLATEADITRDGTGFSYEGFDSLAKHNFKSLRLEINVAGENGLEISAQQPSRVQDSYVLAFVDNNIDPYNRFLVKAHGQGLNWDNQNISAQDHFGWRGIYLKDASLMAFSGKLFSAGSQPGHSDPVPFNKIDNSFDIVLESGLWAESGGIFEIVTCDNIDFGQCHGDADGCAAFVDNDPDDLSSYDIDSIQTNANKWVYHNEFYGIDYHTWGDPDPDQAWISDQSSSIKTLRIEKRPKGPPMLIGRRKGAVRNQSFTATLLEQEYLLQTDSHGDVTIALPTNACAGNHDWYLQRVPATPHNVIVSPNGGKTITDPSGLMASIWTINDNLPHRVIAFQGGWKALY